MKQLADKENQISQSEVRIDELNNIIENLEKEGEEKLQVMDALEAELQQANFEKNRLKEIIQGEEGFDKLRAVVQKL